MHIFIKKFQLLVLILFFCLVGCSEGKKELTIQQYLINKTSSNNVSEANTALFLLADIVLYEKNIQQIKSLYNKESNPEKKLLIAYVLYQRTQEQKYENDFVSLYPTGAKQKAIWDMARQKTDYINISSPLQQRLASFAYMNEKAFDKLLSGYEFADGADAEFLSDQIINIHNNNSEYALKKLKQNDIPLHELGIEE